MLCLLNLYCLHFFSESRQKLNKTFSSSSSSSFCLRFHASMGWTGSKTSTYKIKKNSKNNDIDAGSDQIQSEGGV